MFINETRARVMERCQRLHYWLYLHNGFGIRPIRQDKKLTWGILLHAGLAAHYQGLPIRPALDEALFQEFPKWGDLDYSFKNEWLEEVDWIEKVVGRYIEWAAPQDNFFVEGVEQVGAVVLGESCWQCGAPHRTPAEGYKYWMNNGVVPVPVCPTCYAELHQFVFRLDLLVRDDYGYRVWDHKSTASSVDEFYLKSWEHSSQMWGYCYGAEKQLGHPIGGYTMNIIRKVNSAGEEPDLTKSCPGCGRKKAKGCDLCLDTPGRVPREAKPADKPFHRESFSFTPAKRQWFVEARVRAANKIVEHTRRLAEGDPTAFPRNPSACHSCPMTDLCYQRPELKLHEIWIPEEKYLTKSPDYVKLKELGREEAT